MEQTINKPTAAVADCFHCGGKLGLETLSYDERMFCCEGCKTVYGILKSNNLEQYYLLNQHPGATRYNNAIYLKAFDVLEEPAVATGFIKFKNKDYTIARFHIPSIHCTSCIWLLENLYTLDGRVMRTVVNFNRKEVFVHFDHNLLSLKDLAITLAKIGYEPHLSLNDLSKEEKKDVNKKYYSKLGVAFFCWGNIMLLSFPEYLGLDAIAESGFRQTFGYFNLLLSLPVMFYSSSDFIKSAITGLKLKTLNIDFPIALGIIVMFLRSAAEIVTGAGAGYMDTLASLVFLMLVGRRFQNLSYDKLSFERDYKSYFPLSVTRIEKESKVEKQVPLSEVKTGDRILVRNQEIIPADAILFSGDGLIDYSFVTGEAKPVNVGIGEIIYAGGKQTGSMVEVEILKPVSQSYLTQLWNEDSFNKGQHETLNSITNRVSKYFSFIILGVALLAGAYWIRTDITRAVNAFTAVLIITCPCALALSAPFAFGYIIRGFGRRNFYLKNAYVIEKLAKSNTVIFDKTGTLTSSNEQEITYAGKPLTAAELNMLFSSCKNSGHPLSRKLAVLLSACNYQVPEAYQEISGKGIIAQFRSVVVLIGSASWIAANTGAEVERGELNSSEVHIAVGGNYYGKYLIRNSYRKGLSQLFNVLKGKFDLHILSGDNSSEKEFLKQYIPSESKLHFNQTPFDKLSFVKSLQEEGKQVVMIGDGLNDAGALKQSNVGIAITDSVNNFTPASDAILEGDGLNLLPDFIKASRFAIKVIIGSFIISFLYNIFGTWLAVQGTLTPLVAAILMPLSSVTVVLFITFAVNIYLKNKLK